MAAPASVEMQPAHEGIENCNEPEIIVLKEGVEVAQADMHSFVYTPLQISFYLSMNI